MCNTCGDWGASLADAAEVAKTTARNEGVRLVRDTQPFLALLQPVLEDVRDRGASWWTTRVGFIVATLVGLRFYLWWQYIALEVLVGLLLGNGDSSGDGGNRAADSWWCRAVRRARNMVLEGATLELFLLFVGLTNAVDTALRLGGGTIIPLGVFSIVSMALEGVLSWICWRRLWWLVYSRSSAGPSFHVLEVLVETALWECAPANALAIVAVPASNPAHVVVDGDALVGLVAVSVLTFMLMTNTKASDSARASQRALDTSIKSLAALQVFDAVSWGRVKASALEARHRNFDLSRRGEAHKITHSMFWEAAEPSKDSHMRSPLPPDAAASVQQLDSKYSGTNAAQSVGQVLTWLRGSPPSQLVGRMFHAVHACLVVWLLLVHFGPPRAAVTGWVVALCRTTGLHSAALRVARLGPPVALLGFAATGLYALRKVLQ